MIINLDTLEYLARNPKWALGLGDRLRGMIGRRFPFGEGYDAMVFPRCGSIHAWWMSLPIDVVFVDAESRVLRVRADYRPWSRPLWCRGALTVVELPVGAIAASGTEPGHVLNLNSTLSGEAIEKIRKDAILNAGILPRQAELKQGRE